jgi:O-antigen/teichoic acid export membrane protein
LYSSKFNVIIGFVTFGVLGTFFKAVSFSMGYVIIAKGHSKVFIILSILFNTSLLIICVLSYNRGGLTGIGLGYLIYYFIHLVTLKILTKQLYGISFTKSFYKTFTICGLICASSYGVTLVESLYLRYSLLVLLVGISVGYSIVQFQQKMDLKQLLSSVFKKSTKDQTK